MGLTFFFLTSSAGAVASKDPNSSIFAIEFLLWFIPARARERAVRKERGEPKEFKSYFKS
jgi:hypothetical protein